MNGHFKINSVRLALCLAYPALAVQAMAAEPFPALPVALSAAVTPNVLLIMDTSGSMGSCPSGGCPKKIDSAKLVAKRLIRDNPSLRWGLFSFDGTGTAAKLRAAVGSTSATLNAAIGLASSEAGGPTGMTATGNTPLGEALFEVGRYWAGEASSYSKNTGNYTSPIQYRCQKNFNIFISDGESTADDQNLPGVKSCSQWDWWGNCTKWSAKAVSLVPYDTWNAAGTHLALNFGVCSNTTAINADISCPDKLEGSANTTDIFNDGSSPYVRSVRDVSAFLFDRDMRYNVSDPEGDGKSWDDAKFPKQNVITYTVGFDLPSGSSANGSDGPTVLNATAVVGGGKFYQANNEATLTTSLNNAISSIINSISNAGGVATTTPVKTSGNKLFQPVFNPIGWYGELRCYDYASITYDSDGNINGGACSPNAKAIIPTSDRKVWSATWAPAATWAAFELLPGSPATPATKTSPATLATSPATMTTQQATDLGSTADAQNTVVNFIRGIDVSGTTRVRTKGLLGDITDSQPLVVTAPSGVTTDSDYATFKTANASRGIVFVGANDGMLHAFEITNATNTANNMGELMGFVPSAVYPHLASLPSTGYGSSTAHVFGVNGELRQADVKLGGTTAAWKTIVVGGLAQGGQGFFAVDATSNTPLTTSASTAVKWEWNDQSDNEMGYTFGAPLIYNVRDSATTAVPAVLLVNGYENSYDDTAVGGTLRTATTANPAGNTAALYIVNADTGALIKKIPVPGGTGLSSPAGVDFGQDGVLDYVYAGDMSGKLWRFDLTASAPASFTVATTPIFDAGTSQPITLRPAVKPVTDTSGKSRGNLILFGTGKLLTDGDRSTTDTQSFYAVLDDMSASPTTVPKTSLVQRAIDTTVASVSAGTSGFRAGTYRAITDASVALDLASSSETKKGWYLDFPASTERLVSSPILLDYMILFGTGIPASAEKCVPGGSGWVMGLNPMTGGVTASAGNKQFSFVDIKLDGKSTVDDKRTFSTGAAYASGFSTVGIPTELTYVADASKIVTISSATGSLGNAGSAIALQDANMMAVYTGNSALDANGAATTTTGAPMGRPSPDASQGGEVVVCGIGGVKCEKNRLNGGGGGGGNGYKIETTIWREIK